jgi:hypothetical protein
MWSQMLGVTRRLIPHIKAKAPCVQEALLVISSLSKLRPKIFLEILG